MRFKTTILFVCLSSFSSIVMAQWTAMSFLSKGYNLMYGYHPTIIDNNTAIICGNYTTDYVNYTGKIFRTTNGGSAFSEVLSMGVVGFQDAFFLNNATGFAVGQNNNSQLIIAKSVNAGATWTTTLSDSLFSGYDVYFFDANNGLIAGEGGIIRTNNGGGTWKVVLSSGLTISQFSFPTSSVGYAIATGFPSSKVFKTIDGGNTWVDISTSSTDQDLRGVCFTSITSGLIACGGDTFLLKTIDGGQNWSHVTVPELSNLYDIKFVNASLGYLVGETFSEAIIFKTTDAGNTWKKDYSTPNYFSHYGLDVKGSFALACGLGGFAKNSTISSVQEFTLNNNIKVYPTITSDEIKIKNSENNPVDSHYYICDILGNIIKTGYFRESITISLSEVQSGVYIVSVSNKSGVSNQKVIKE